MESPSNSRTKSRLRSSLQRSNSPSSSFCSSSISSSSTRFGSPVPKLSTSGNSGFLTRSTSPTRVNIRGSSTSSSPSIRFSIDRSTSPSRPLAVNQKQSNKPLSGQKKTCMCSPTTHPGSFRCSLHKNGGGNQRKGHDTVPYHSNRLYARRSAMTNSLVRIGTVEGDLVKRALAALIRPSSHQQRRRADFQPRPSRLSTMSKAGDDS